MNIAILFWFYKEPEVCESRLKLLRKHNPHSKVFGLYGGDGSVADVYEQRLQAYLDDFYAFTANSNAHWKWRNGDLMMLDWHDKRGRNLQWDSVVVIQWDTLVFDSVERQLEGMRKGEIYLSGLRALDQELEQRWFWTRSDGDRQHYLDFLEYVKARYGYGEQPLCSLFILPAVPREFFEKYLTVSDREYGFLEYKIPVYAKIFGVPFFERDLGARWDEEARPLSAARMPLSASYVEQELAKPNGWRIFHPYHLPWPDESRS
jgi:hypothetical protein